MSLFLVIVPSPLLFFLFFLSFAPADVNDRGVGINTVEEELLASRIWSSASCSLFRFMSFFDSDFMCCLPKRLALRARLSACDMFAFVDGFALAIDQLNGQLTPIFFLSVCLLLVGLAGHKTEREALLFMGLPAVFPRKKTLNSQLNSTIFLPFPVLCGLVPFHHHHHHHQTQLPVLCGLILFHHHHK